jgi:hypothetical protein
LFFGPDHRAIQSSVSGGQVAARIESKIRIGDGRRSASGTKFGKPASFAADSVSFNVRGISGEAWFVSGLDLFDELA